MRSVALAEVAPSREARIISDSVKMGIRRAATGKRTAFFTCRSHARGLRCGAWSRQTESIINLLQWSSDNVSPRSLFSFHLRFLIRRLNPRPHLPSSAKVWPWFHSSALRNHAKKKIQLEHSPASKVTFNISQSAFAACVEAPPWLKWLSKPLLNMQRLCPARFGA